MHDSTGVFLSDSKQVLVANRLSARIRILGFANCQDYYDYITHGEGISNGELQRSIDLLTTHETHFFRESAQFDFLREQILPKFKNAKPLRLWSAACSTGEEPYSLGMVVADHLGWAMDWTVLATDISATALEQARMGIYDHKAIQAIPAQYHRRFLMRGVRSQTGYFGMVPELRRHINFQHYNLVASPPPKLHFDVIFCRNVLIYFDHDTKLRVVNRLCTNLKVGGYLLTGHSETMLTNTQLKSISPSVFLKWQA